jgi:hypothetical protein
MIEWNGPARSLNFPCKRRREKVEKKEMTCGIFLRWNEGGDDDGEK